ncbi:MAG: hypothetical protein K9M97_11905 [Akkermansiaceae bacterium]|nr:hypothetical protein [Akkermansiaceae bacterium]
MSHDLQELEAKLHALRPAALDPELSARLADTARRTGTTLTPVETQFAASLRRINPAPLPADLAATILRKTTGRETTVVPFPAAKPAATRHRGRYMLPIAAAVALLGAATALLIPTQPNDSAVATNGKTTARPGPPPPPVPRSASNFVPAGFSTDLSQASDEGVLWQSPGQPRRVVKVVYRDRVTLIDQHGRKYEVEQPRVEYILLPEKLD